MKVGVHRSKKEKREGTSSRLSNSSAFLEGRRAARIEGGSQAPAPRCRRYTVRCAQYAFGLADGDRVVTVPEGVRHADVVVGHARGGLQLRQP